MYLCMHAYVWRSEVNLRCHSSGDVHLVFWDKVSLWPGTCQVGLARLVSYCVPGICLSLQSQGWGYKHTQFFIWVLGFKFRSLCLHGKHFPNRAISQSPTLFNMVHTCNSNNIIYLFTHMSVNIKSAFTWLLCRTSEMGLEGGAGFLALSSMVHLSIS